MAGNGRKTGDEGLVIALAGGASVREAAEASGLSERTIYRRLEDPAFRQQVQDVRGEFVRQAVGRLAAASTEAVATLRALLNADGESARLGAARSILELGSKLRESLELEARIAALEAQQHGAG
jgi:hypothetical protein